MKPHEMYAAVMVDHLLGFVTKCDILGGDTLVLTRDLLSATLATDAHLQPAERAVISAAIALLEERLWKKVEDVIGKKDQNDGGGGGPAGLD